MTPFYDRNPNDQYCSIQAEPKVRKVREKFGEQVNSASPPGQD